MLQIIHSIPSKCPVCQAPKSQFGGLDHAVSKNGNLLLCQECGTYMTLQEDEEATKEPRQEEVGACFISCPHCHHSGEILLYGDQEYCSGCGLDPHRCDYEAEGLASLWKEDSEIRSLMEKNSPGRDQLLFQWLKKSCGPHCNYSDRCLQTKTKMLSCFRKDIPKKERRTLLNSNTIEPETNDRRKKRKESKREKKERKRREKAKRKHTPGGRNKAVVIFSANGWYAKVRGYSDRTSDPQKHSYTESGPGTQGISERSSYDGESGMGGG